MSNKELHYFATFGLGEGIRYLLHYGGIKFNDIQYTIEGFRKAKSQFKYGQVPLYIDGDKRLNQSLAIARYLGTTLKLNKGDVYEDARLDALALNVYDFWLQIFKFYKEQDPVKKAAIKTQIETEFVDFFFSRFEEEIQANGGYLAGKLTWVDFFLVGCIEAANHYCSIKVQKNYPGVTSLLDKVLNLPNIKAYIATRKPYII